MTSPHLPAARLASDALGPDEALHLAGCVRCRAERRVRQLRAAAPVRRLGRYEVVGELGSGGMGRVYAVRHPTLGIERAVKVLDLPGRRARERFRREARLQRRVDHPNVLPLLEVLDVEDGAALVLPLVEGPSLDRLLAAHRLHPEDALAVFRQLCAGVGAIHRASLVHRDVKPANVLLDVAGPLVVRVADFGLARILSDEVEDTLTRSGAQLGTPAYMAPEQRLDPRRADARADVWALGAVLWEMVTGRRRGADDDVSSADLPDGLRPLLADLLRSDPARRPPDAEAVLAALPPVLPPSDELVAACRALVPTPARPSLDGSATSAGPPEPVPNNLRSDEGAFVGRRGDLVALAALLDAHHLVSLTGPPGVGKTRCALQYARTWLDEHPGGVWACDLSAAADGDGIVRAVAGALDVPLGPDDPAERLGRAIGGRGRCLLVLDDLDRGVAAATATLGRWLELAPDARFLVTSRQRVGIPAEAIHVLSPLATDEGVELFLWRAEQVHRAFRPDERDRAALAELVVLLDGLPLAIELAAARVAVMAPAVLVERLAERFRLLAAPGPAPGRHATLRAAIDWSWDLLRPDEQAALAQLTVFEGGFDLAAAEAVLALRETWPVDAVQALVQRSLVTAEGARFHLLASVREYARERLADPAPVELRHGLHYAAAGTDGDVEDLVAACRRALARRDEDVAAATALAAWAVLERRGPFGLAVELLRSATPATGPRRARMIEAHGAALRACGQAEEARHLLREALGLHDAAEARGRVLGTLGCLEREHGDLDAARALLEDALAIHRRAGDRRAEGLALNDLGTTHRMQGRMDLARSLHEQSLAIRRELGDRAGEGAVRATLGILERVAGRFGEARPHLDAALAVHREVGSRDGEGTTLQELGVVHRLEGRLAEAEECFREALGLARRVGNRVRELGLVRDLGGLHMERGAYDEARSAFDAALHLAVELRSPREELRVRIWLGNLATARGRLDEARARFEEALAQGRRLAEGPMVAMVLGNLGNVNRAVGRLDEAEEQYDEALVLHREQRRDRSEALVRVGRGNVRLQLGDAEGAREDLEHALRRARERGDVAVEAHATTALAQVELACGRLDEARARIDRALELARSIPDRELEAAALGYLATVHGHRGDLGAAWDAAARGEVVARELGSPTALAEVLVAKAELGLVSGDRSTTDTSLDELAALAEEIGVGPRSELATRMATLRSRSRGGA